MTMPLQHPPADIADLAADLDSFKAAVIAEITELRLLLRANNIEPPPSALDDGWVTLQRYAENNHISTEAVLSRIRRQALVERGLAKKVGGRWRLKCTVCMG
jgi:hypothetical protein